MMGTQSCRLSAWSPRRWFLALTRAVDAHPNQFIRVALPPGGNDISAAEGVLTLRAVDETNEAAPLPM